MSYRKQVASILVVYTLLSVGFALLLNLIIIDVRPEGSVFNFMPIFGPAVFLLPMLWGALFYFTAIFGAGYLISTVLILAPIVIGWKREPYVRGVSLLIGAAIWLLTGFIGTMMLID